MYASEEELEASLATLRALIDDPDKTENDLQRHLEENTELLPTPDLLNHRLNFRSVISKFSVGPWKIDYAYLTKSSNLWRLVMVELESPHKRLFTDKDNHLGFSAAFNGARAQVETWQTEIRQNDRPLRDSIRMLQQHMAGNAIEYQYLLVIGRDRELEQHPARRNRLGALQADHRLHVMTWDSLLRLPDGGFAKKCVLTQTAHGFKIKHLDRDPGNLFAYLRPGELQVSASDVETLKADGYDMDAWQGGELLTVNQRWPASRGASTADAIVDSVLDSIAAATNKKRRAP